MLARCQPSLMIPTGCWAGLPGNDFAFACKQRADPPGLSEGREDVDSNEEGGPDGTAVEEEGWFGNASDTRSESSSFGDTQDEVLLPRGSSPDERPGVSAGSGDHDTCGGDSSLGCPTPVHRASLELLGLDGGAFSAQDTLSSVVSSLYGEAASRALGKPLSSNLRRLLEAGSLKLDTGELLGRSSRGGAGGDSPPIGLAPPLTLSPSSHHAQQLSALARKLASNNNNSGSASPASTAPSATNIKQEPLDPFNSVTPSNGSGFVWAGVADKWPPASCSTPCGSSLSPDSAIQKLKAAANAVLQDKNAVASSSTTSSSSSTSASSAVPTLGGGGRGDDVVRFDAFNSPFSPQSASSTLAALSKKVSERSQASSTGSAATDHQAASSFLSLVSMTSSAALLKEVAARAAGNLLAEKKDGSPLATTGVLQEDVKPLLDKNQKAPTPSTPNQSLELLLPSPPKGRGKPSNQAGSPEDGGKPFQCPVCGLVIKRKSYWKRHMVIHTGLKSHQCPLCPFRCARKDNLKSHMKVHQHQDRGETFQCELCPFTSSRHFSLKLHMRCHQHFPRTDVKVKEEITTDTEGEGSLMGDGSSADMRATEVSPLHSDAQQQTSPPVEASSNHVHIKEEPQERDLSVLSPFSICRDRASSSANSLDLPGVGVGVGVRSSPSAPTTASLFSPDITTKTATDLLMKLSAANQRETLKSPFQLKEEPKVEEALSPRPSSQSQSQIQPSFPTTFSPDGPTVAAAATDRPGSLKAREGSPMAKNSLLSQDINVKVASELLIKLSENNKDAQYQKVKVKAEPMEVDPPPADLTPPASHMLAFSTLGASEKSEPMSNLHETLACPQKDLFSQDISVKMASELLFKLSEKVSKANNHKDSNMVGINSPFLDECFRQSPFNSRSKSTSPAEASSSTRVPFNDSEKDDGELGNGIAQWRLNEQLFPCPICGKVFGRQQTLSRHLSLHTEERKYKCHLCPYAAKCRANLNQHLTIHSVKLVNTDAEQIVSAVTADSTERKNCPYYYSCHVCGFQTELNAQFVSHMSLHVDKEQWMFSLCCSVCDYVCMEETDMRNHISTGHAGLNSRSPLSETKSTSSSLSALSDSLNSSEGGDLTHGNEELKSLLAPPSSAGSQSSSGSHSGSGTEDKSDKGFECVFCNFVCKTRSMYERHLQIHLITRMFECDVCHKFLKTPEQLLEHKKCHTVPSGGLKCPFCIYSTNRPAAMECHLKTHCKMEYRCRICQGLWPDQASLEAHMRRHRLGNHYKCEQCGYLSKTANKLIEHVRVHTGERPFHCDRCSYSCKRKDNLNLHKKLKHAPRQTFGCQECPFTTTHPFVFSRHLKKHQSGGTGGMDGALGGGGGGGEEEEEDEEAVGEELPMETSPGGSSLQKSQENFLFGGGGGSSSGGSGSNSPLMSLTASQALQSVALSLTLGKSQQLDPACPRHGLVNANGVGGAAPRDPSGASVAGDSGSPSLFLPSSRHMLEQYRNCDQAHLIPLTTLFTHNSRFTFHSQLHSRWRPATSPLLFSSNLASPSRSFPSPSSHKHSFLAYLGLMERAKTV
ncbi:zinc finger protein 827 isoform X1 [Simochromis diagramma]|uniref:zinc finger protein 827 isoform X1 n=1 Tax=Simochromis diagramma TaxID=43689 RepID=UPI001A7E1C5D|nr:zinc finger protein 827 isoform X1 [Simochromis diagramma]